MRRYLIVLLAAMLSTPLYGQRKERDYGNFDFEFGFDIPVAAAVLPDMTNYIIPGLYFEGRLQLEQLPINIGFHLGLSVMQRRDGYKDNYRAVPFLAIADWQFGRGKRFNPYVGLGAGLSLNVLSNTVHDQRANPAIYPRVGVRCWKFLNASMGYLATEKDYSRLRFNLGFYF